MKIQGKEFKLLEKYKGKNIVKTSGGSTIEVHDPVEDTLFIVSMDDSKSCGHRTFDDSANNVKTAKDYIDWLKPV